MIKRSTVDVAEAGLSLALAVVLNFFKLFEAPMGGSVSLEMLPIFLLGFRRGWKIATLMGFAYGCLNFIFHPIFLHPIQFLLDYAGSFALVGFSTILYPYRRREAQYGRAFLGIVIGVLFRFLAHFTSGVVFFSANAPQGWSPWLYSLAYNGAYLFFDLVLCLFFALLVIRLLEEGGR